MLTLHTLILSYFGFVFFFLSTFTFGFSEGISSTKSILFLERSVDGTADVYVTTKWS